MRKIAEIRGEEALDILVDLMEPAIEIMADPNVRALAKDGKKIDAIKVAIKGHKKAVITILAILEEENPETYSPSITILPIKLLELCNDPELVEFFQSQGQTGDGMTSGSAMENTKAAATE